MSKPGLKFQNGGFTYAKTADRRCHLCHGPSDPALTVGQSDLRRRHKARASSNTYWCRGCWEEWVETAIRMRRAHVWETAEFAAEQGIVFNCPTDIDRRD